MTKGEPQPYRPCAARCIEDLVTGLLHDPRPRVIALKDAMAKSHEPERIVLVLGTLDVFRDAVHRADLLKHHESTLIGAPIRRPPQAGDSRRDAGKWIGSG